MKKSNKKKKADNDKGRRIDDLRARFMAVKAASGLSFEEISRKVGVTFSALSRFGNGVTKSPNQLTLEAIERFVNEEESKA